MKESLAEIIAMMEEPNALIGRIIYWVFLYIDDADEDLSFLEYLKQEYALMETYE